MTYQKITAGFKTDQALEQTQRSIQEHLGTAVQSLVPKTATVQARKVSKTKWDIVKAAFAGGLLGMLIGSLGVFSAIGSSVPLTVLAPLSGAVVGSAAGSLISFLSGSIPGSVRYDYQLMLEVPIEAVQAANKIILEQGGHIL